MNHLFVRSITTPQYPEMHGWKERSHEQSGSLSPALKMDSLRWYSTWDVSVSALSLYLTNTLLRFRIWMFWRPLLSLVSQMHPWPTLCLWEWNQCSADTGYVRPSVSSLTLSHNTPYTLTHTWTKLLSYWTASMMISLRMWRECIYTRKFETWHLVNFMKGLSMPCCVWNQLSTVVRVSALSPQASINVTRFPVLASLNDCLSISLCCLQ